CIIGSIQYLILIFVLLHSVIELIFFLFAYRKKQEVFLKIVTNENQNAQHYKALIHSIDNEIWTSKRLNIIQRIKNNYSSIYKNYSDVVLFKSNSSLFKTLLKSFCEICLIATMSYLIIKTDKLTIGKLTFIISAFALFRNSSSELFNYFLSKVEFNVYWQVYKDLTTVSNAQIKEFSLKQEIKSLTFKLEDTKYQLLTKKENLVDLPFAQVLKQCRTIYVNTNKANQYHYIFNKTILLDQQSQIDIQQLIQQIEKSPVQYSQYIQYFKLDLNTSNQPFYKSILINLLSLLDEHNKIIFIDDVLCFIKKQDLIVVKQLLNKIKKNNYVFVIRKEKND
ncbi:MAG: hypothetical protein KBS35_00750, partial [Mycoplasma sp.]|nr:hypothetical protein [Candidatus Hennigella equi]